LQARPEALPLVASCDHLQIAGWRYKITQEGVDVSQSVFIVGAALFNMQKMRNVEIDADYRLHELLRFDEVKGKRFYPVEECLEKARECLQASGGSMDAILGYWFFRLLR